MGPCCALAEHLSTHSCLLKWLPLKLRGSAGLRGCRSPGRPADESTALSHTATALHAWHRNSYSTHRQEDRQTPREIGWMLVLFARVLFHPRFFFFFSPFRIPRILLVSMSRNMALEGNFVPISGVLPNVTWVGPLMKL